MNRRSFHDISVKLRVGFMPLLSVGTLAAWAQSLQAFTVRLITWI